MRRTIEVGAALMCVVVWVCDSGVLAIGMEILCCGGKMVAMAIWSCQKFWGVAAR